MQLKLMLAAAAGLTMALASTVQAAEIKLMSSLGMRVMLTDLITDFERTTGHMVTAAYGAPGPIKTRIAEGELVDVVVLPAPGLDDLVKQGKIVADSKVILARSNMGVGMRVGAPKPDISTPEAFKRVLLAAKSISYSDPAIGSPSGAHVVKVLERLGIAEDMKAKSKPYSGPGYHTELVAKGEIEISLAQISEILPVQGAELAGPLPAELQLTTVYQTGIGTATKDQAAAKAFIAFLMTPAAAALIKAKGMEPVTPSAELKVLSVQPLKPLLDELGPEFERATGHKLSIRFDVSAALKRQIDAGEAFDVALILPASIDDLLKQGKVAAGTRTDIARAAIGVAVKRGATKPDIGSAEALKRTLLNATSIAYSGEGASGIYFKTVLERLGIAAETSAKLKPLASSAVVPAVANGDVELAVISPPAILAEPGAELVGILPKELQNYVVYTAGVSATAKEADAAKALLKFLTTPAAMSVMKSKGLEPAVP